MTPQDLDALALRARDGDKHALGALATALQDRVYNLAMRVLGHPADAEDAAQEILVLVVTHLSTFRGDSALTTWVYTLASRHLRRFRATRAARAEQLRLEDHAEHLGRAPDPERAARADDELLTEETFLGCTQAMLLALDRDHRLAFVLGSIFELDGATAAAALGIEPATFRKRVSRARKRLSDFLLGHCGVADPKNACRCKHQVDLNIARGNIDPERLRLATHACHRPTTDQRRALRRRIAEVAELDRVMAIYRSHPDYRAPGDFGASVRAIIDSGRFETLS